MSLMEVLAIAGFGLTILGTICAGVWWMSALFSHVKSNGRHIGSLKDQVKGVQTDVRDIKGNLEKLNSGMTKHVTKCDPHRADLETRLKSLEDAT